jgi:hypothetical protein
MEFAYDMLKKLYLAHVLLSFYFSNQREVLSLIWNILQP